MAEPMRIAQVIGKAVQGGVDTLVMNYYLNIDRSKVQFDFFMDGLDETVHDDKIRVLGGKLFKLPPYEKGMRKNLREFRRILKENHYKIIHCHMNSLSVFWLREAKRAGVPVRIAHSHSTASMSEGLRTLLKYFLRPFSKIYPTHFAACSNYAAAWLFGKRLLKSDRVFAVRNAIKLDAFRFDPGVRLRLRETLGLKDKYVIGHVGRFVEQKNHGFLIDIFREAHNAHPDTLLLLVGDGELKTEAERKVLAYGLSEAVVFLGNRTDVNELYQAMDVFVLPSYYEGLPIVAVEAQAAGLPCLLSDKITREAILSDDALLIPIDDAKNWAREIDKFRNHSRQSDLRRLAADGFDIKEAASALCDYYCSL